MTHVSPQLKGDGQIQLKLLDAWTELSEALEMAADPVFGTSSERREWITKLKAVRGCVLLAAARLIDISHIEAVPQFKKRERLTVHAFAKRQARTVGESSVIDKSDEVADARKTFTLLCPVGVPLMEFSLGRLAAWVEAGEMQVAGFFGVASTPGKKRAKAVVKKAKQREEVLDALAVHDAALERVGWKGRSLASKGREMRIRAGVEEGQ